jgi:hypothetical protein
MPGLGDFRRIVSIRSKRRIREALETLGADTGLGCVAIDWGQLSGLGADNAGEATGLTSSIML